MKLLGNSHKILITTKMGCETNKVETPAVDDNHPSIL